MSRTNLFFLAFFVFSLAVAPLRGDDSHSHEQEKKVTNTPHDEHGDKDKDKEHEEEENSAVGPGKGITEFSPEKGLRLSPEAAKSFGIVISPIVSSKSGFVISHAALLEAQDGKYVYLDKFGMLKRVPVEVEKKGADTVLIKSRALSPDSKIVTSGVPFLRAAELDVTTGGGSHGH